MLTEIDKKALKSLMKMAGTDLKASRILLKEKLYLQSIFLLQQAVEKANKVMAIQGEFLTLKTLKSTGHSQAKLVKALVQQHLDEIKLVNSGQEKVPIFFQLMKDSSIDFSAYEKELIDLPSHIEEFRSQTDAAKIGTKQLNEIIGSIYQGYEDAEKLIRSPSFRQHIMKHGPWILNKLMQTELFQDHIELFSVSGQEDLLEFLNIMVEVFNKTIIIVVTNLSLQMMGFLFGSLAAKVRYPDLEGDQFFDPTILFTGRHPLVKMLSELHALTGKALMNLKKLENSF